MTILWAKIALFMFFYVWVRWTFPRFRYDQLMRLGWKVAPAALAGQPRLRRRHDPGREGVTWSWRSSCSSRSPRWSRASWWSPTATRCYSTLALVVTLISTAGLFVLLGSPFLAALQVLLYTGAILVLFLFVIMLLNVQRERTSIARSPLQTWGALVAAFVLAGAVCRLFWDAHGDTEVGPARSRPSRRCAASPRCSSPPTCSRSS